MPKTLIIILLLFAAMGYCVSSITENISNEYHRITNLPYVLGEVSKVGGCTNRCAAEVTLINGDKVNLTVPVALAFEGTCVGIQFDVNHGNNYVSACADITKEGESL